MSSNEDRARMRRGQDGEYERETERRNSREAAWRRRWGALEAALEAVGVDPGELREWIAADPGADGR